MLLDYIKNRIQRTAIRIGTACIRNKYKRGALRSKLLYKHSPVSFTIYNKFFPVYPPHYSPDNLPYGDEPKIYNKDGERMRMFFFRDYISALFPAAPSKYFLCDRYNFGLDTHFYGNWSMLEPMGKPTRRYGYLYETKAIFPYDYRIFEENEGLHKDFDLIFTHERDIIEKYDNARFFPNWAISCIPPELSTPDLVDRKTRKASIVSSNKRFCRLHDVRSAAARYCKAHPELGVDTFGTFDGGPLIPLEDSLLRYRYSIAIENYVSPWLFTERLISCFAACTVPIYLGATDVGRFFNTDGIIRISENDLYGIDKIVAQCTESDYAARREAILDNFQRAQEYNSPWDRLYAEYLR